jgi:hypothetical protein
MADANTQTTNTGTTGTTTTAQDKCANCGMPKDEWRGNSGQGFAMNDQTYCCQGCAIGTGCTCD